MFWGGGSQAPLSSEPLGLKECNCILECENGLETNKQKKLEKKIARGCRGVRVEKINGDSINSKPSHHNTKKTTLNKERLILNLISV